MSTPIRSYPALTTIGNLFKVLSVLNFVIGLLVAIGIVVMGFAGNEKDLSVFGGVGAGMGMGVASMVSAILLWAVAESILVLVNLGVDVSKVAAAVAAEPDQTAKGIVRALQAVAPAPPPVPNGAVRPPLPPQPGV